jgi:hypothetical protein
MVCPPIPQDLNVVLGIVGAVATVPTTLTLPGMYLALMEPEKKWVRLQGWLAFAIGNALMILCLYSTLAGASS